MCSLCVTGADATVSDLLLSVTEFNILMFYNRVVDGFFCGRGEKFEYFLHYYLHYLNLSNFYLIFPYLNFTESFKIKYEIVIALYLIRENAPTSLTLRK